jgi:group II intron reverse transcriptase/maturase
MERAKRDPNAQFNSLAHLLDVDALRRAFDRIRKDAAVGVNGVSKEAYAENLEQNLQDLHERLRSRKYRHQPIRRVHIPKAPGKTRPIGVSSIEDKIVQGALTEVLQAIYEQDFLEGSYGFRPKRGAHDALRAVNHMVFQEGMGWILEADIQAFFDSVVRARLREMLQVRVVDGSLLRLIGKCLRVGVLDGEQFTTPGEGTTQGSIISPLLGNVYLHYALDLWLEREVKPKLQGRARLIRYADDFVIGFSEQQDAERVLGWLKERMAEYGLTLHPDKTRLVAFQRPAKGEQKNPSRSAFDFLGFTLFWRRSHKGMWALAMKTRKARVQRTLQALNDLCRRQRHRPLEEQHAALVRRLRGHYSYFGVNGNSRSLSQIWYRLKRIWLFWLRRRSQRARRLTWERFTKYLDRFPLPRPRIAVQIWATP